MGAGGILDKSNNEEEIDALKSRSPLLIIFRRSSSSLVKLFFWLFLDKQVFQVLNSVESFGNLP
jgi:hypothetical protein